MRNEMRWLLLPLLVSCTHIGSQQPSRAIETYCRGVAGESETFIPVYPPQQGILPNTILELQLSRGWETPSNACIPFDVIARGSDGDLWATSALLPDFITDRRAAASGELGVAALPYGIAANASLSDTIQLGFDDVSKLRAPSAPRDIIVELNGVRMLDPLVYPLEKYRDKVGPDRSKRHSLFFLRVDEVYSAEKVRYTLGIESAAGAGADAANLAKSLTVTTNLDWEYTGKTLFADRPYKPPLAVAVSGILYEISCRDGRLIRFQRFPVVAR
ncbi:MAG TPA: hypothetical protein VE974_14900 [Thermoanaerobaculia bacterium]|nr:hypothetical protein [Thermoanaerobaculia bacterium]